MAVGAGPLSVVRHEKAQAPGRTGGMPSHLSPRLLRAWANRVQTGACIVRQAQERTMPEYIRPGTVSSTLAVTPAAVEVHNNVRWVCLIWGLIYNSQVGLSGHLAAASPAWGPEHVTSNCRSLSAQNERSRMEP